MEASAQSSSSEQNSADNGGHLPNNFDIDVIPKT